MSSKRTHPALVKMEIELLEDQLNSWRFLKEHYDHLGDLEGHINNEVLNIERRIKYLREKSENNVKHQEYVQDQINKYLQGKSGDLLIVDDPYSSEDIDKKKAKEWYENIFADSPETSHEKSVHKTLERIEFGLYYIVAVLVVILFVTLIIFSK